MKILQLAILGNLLCAAGALASRCKPSRLASVSASTSSSSSWPSSSSPPRSSSSSFSSASVSTSSSSSAPSTTPSLNCTNIVSNSDFQAGWDTSAQAGSVTFLTGSGADQCDGFSSCVQLDSTTPNDGFAGSVTQTLDAAAFVNNTLYTISVQYRVVRSPAGNNELSCWLSNSDTYPPYFDLYDAPPNTWLTQESSFFVTEYPDDDPPRVGCTLTTENDGAAPYVQLTRLELAPAACGPAASSSSSSAPLPLAS